MAQWSGYLTGTQNQLLVEHLDICLSKKWSALFVHDSNNIPLLFHSIFQLSSASSCVSFWLGCEPIRFRCLPVVIDWLYLKYNFCMSFPVFVMVCEIVYIMYCHAVCTAEWFWIKSRTVCDTCVYSFQDFQDNFLMFFYFHELPVWEPAIKLVSLSQLSSHFLTPLLHLRVAWGLLEADKR